MAYQGERSFSDVLQDIVGNVQTIIRSEIQLAKTEVKEETSKASKASAVIVAGAILGLYSVGFLLLTLVRGFETVAAPWLASLIVAVLVGVVAFIAISAGRTRMRHVHATPEKTIQTVKENVEWAKDQTR